MGIAIGAAVFYLAENNSQNNKNQLVTGESSTDNDSWTCSMHPQIMQPEPGDCPICGMDLIPADSSGEGLAANEIQMTDNAMALANIQTSIVGTDAGSNSSLQLSGKIKINQDQTATLPAHFDGRVEQLFVKTLGEKVSKGQKIATVYAPALITAQQELITTASLKNSQPELYKAVRAKFKNWKIHGDILDQVETTSNIVKEFPIYSHVSGVVTEIVINEGAHIMDGAPILKVSDLSSVWVELDAYENQISDLKVGQEMTIISNAYPNEEFTAQVTFIDPLLDNSTRTTTVRAALENKDGLFKPGMFVTGTVALNSTDDTFITIPATAVIWTGKRSLVYIKTQPDAAVFEMREVQLGKSVNDQYIITDGLAAGDEIVTQGTFTVDAAAQLQGKTSMMNAGLAEIVQNNNTTSGVDLPSQFEAGLKAVIPHYLNMKDAFVKGDVDGVSAFAKAGLSALNSLNKEALKEPTLTQISTSTRLMKLISMSTNLEEQRNAFVSLNENFIDLVKNMKEIEPLLYVQQCPMASNNKGAAWLSTEKDIRNPYYGDAMLSCGSVIDEIK